LSFTKGFTEDGFEQTVGVNYLGPFLLTSLLLPLFSSGEDNRIINLTSMVWPLGSVTLINELMQRSTDWVNIRM
jgi:NAD(P)-dependent dehydrogenase (short-subunit alcohol dehydrogenase family)